MFAPFASPLYIFKKHIVLRSLAVCLVFLSCHEACASVREEEALAITATMTPSASNAPVLGKLTQEECEALKEICSLFTKSSPDLISNEPKRGWIKKKTLDDLKILTYLEQKKIKFDRSLDHQLHTALNTFYQLVLNLETKTTHALQSAILDSLLNSVSSDAETTEEILKEISGLHKTPKVDVTEFSPYMPTLRKMMRALVRYAHESKGMLLQETCGIVPLDDKARLGYVKDREGYLPISFIEEPTYKLLNLPLGSFPEGMQGGCLVKDGTIIEESGLLVEIDEYQDKTPVQKAFIYCGVDSEHPFTVSPFKFMSAPSALHGASPEDDYLKQLLGDDMPESGKAAFMVLPMKAQDKNILEVLFLEDLIAQGEQKDKDALQMIAYIEQETGKKIEQVIKDLSEEQLKIIAEQQAISKAVVEESIIGRQKSTHSTKKKEKEKKQTPHKASEKDDVLKQQDAAKHAPSKSQPSDIFNDIKQKGRHKYRKVLGVINRVMKRTISQTLTENRKGGSHKTLHGEKGMVTLVKPHGKQDLTLSPRGLKRFSERLLSLVDLQ